MPAAPACPLFGRCGGCQLQALSYAEQLTLKTERVRALFPELAVDACAPSPREYGYRSKLTPHFARPRPGRPAAIGFLEVGEPPRTVDVPACPLGTPAVNAALAQLRARVLSQWESYRRGGSLLVREAASGVTDDPRAVITEEVGDLSLQFRAGDFFQNNPFLLPSLVEHVVTEARRDGARFLVDAYCGSGLLGLAAAPHFEQVMGVEVSGSAVAWARANAERNHRTNCTFLASDAAAIFSSVPFPPGDAAVIVDPPRKGCGPTFMAQLLAFAPRTIVYVSCNPETQAPEIERLRQSGYRCDRIQPFDMFPQTRHVECVATLNRSA